MEQRNKQKDQTHIGFDRRAAESQIAPERCYLIGRDFDGRQAIHCTSVTRFELSNGITAFFGTNNAPALTIVFASGERILIRVESPTVMRKTRFDRKDAKKGRNDIKILNSLKD